MDDEATSALMKKFYELWNPRDGKPGLPTAEALRKAQEFVRDDPAHPKWKHPYYWAAWVLWGLPDQRATGSEAHRRQVRLALSGRPG